MPESFASLRVGIDLDNTLISYDRLFLEAARQRGLVPADFSGSKREVRDYIRLLPDGEIEWQRLQAHAYGPAIGGAVAAPGALDFIVRLRSLGGWAAIVSHKTAYSNLAESPVNLRDSARGWLRESGIIGPDRVPEDLLFFEDTRDEKIARIAALRCTHFIDDLEEVFDDAAFPAEVERLLYVTDEGPAEPRAYPSFTSFASVAEAIFADRHA